MPRGRRGGRQVGRTLGLMAVVLITLAGSMARPQPAAAGGSWRTTGPLLTGRYGHTATLLPSGKVLVVGGWNGSNLSSAEIYNPVTGQWSSASSLTHGGRSNHTATLLNTGKVLVVGGGSNICELYDPGGDSWSDAGSLSINPEDHTATLLNNGQVLVAGGYYGGCLANAELYNPNGGTWTDTGFLHNGGRYAHTATLLNTGQVLVAGGYNGGCLTTAELYDPNGGTWTATGALTNGRSQHTATKLANGKVLVAGGYDDRNQVFPAGVELYDPTGGTWSPTAALTNGRSQPTATLLRNGRVLLVGGLYGIWPESLSWLASAYLYNSSKGTWSATASLKFAREGHTATLLPDGRVLVAGGLNDAGPMSSAELYYGPNVTAIINLLLPH